VQGEDELEVVGQVGEEGDLGRARVAEEPGHPEVPQDVEDGVADGMVYKLPLAANPRAKMMGIKDGFVKLIARQGSGSVIGGVIVGPRASELIYPIAIAVERRLTVDQVSRVFAVYTSLSGTITDAARAMHVVDHTIYGA
jgi:dihydrolipoamide dehydrogenase